MRSESLLLIDAPSLYFRSFFALPASLVSREGRPVNAIRGFLDALAIFVSEYQPTQVACCLDGDWRPAWRVQQVPSYKTHRVATDNEELVDDALAQQVPLLVDVLHALGLAVIEADEAEADDVIATLTERASCPVNVVTGDRDLFQLVDDSRHVRVLYLSRGIRNHTIVTDTWLVDRYGISGRQYADFATLRGDPSDGLPGVAGIGEKTAARLITEHGNLVGVLAAEEAGLLPARLAQNLRDASDYLGRVAAVVKAQRDLALPVAMDELQIPAQPVQPARLASLADHLNLGGSVRRIVAALAQSSGTNT